MCTAGSCNHDHGPSAFSAYIDKVAGDVTAKLQDASETLDADSVTRGLVSLDMDCDHPEALAAYMEVMNTTAFAHNMLIGALQMRAGEDPGGCRETTVEELMRQTFEDAVGQVVAQALHSQAA